jgi:nitrite reductase/ring-hydroxylating ferredoxin subunit
VHNREYSVHTGSSRVTAIASRMSQTTTGRLGSPVYLRNYWYPLLRSQDLGAQPKAVLRFGDDLVLWRDATGTAHVQADCCPHRGTRLSGGEVVDNCIMCPYHHFRYDGSGQCALAPFEGPGGRLAKRLRVRTFPSEEVAGLVWAWMSHDDSLAVPPLRVGTAGTGIDDTAARYPEGGVPYEVASPDWSGTLAEIPAPGNWRLVLENATDIYHGATLHAGTFRRSRFAQEGMRADRVDVRSHATPEGGVRSEMVIDGVVDDVGLTTYPWGLVVLSLHCRLSSPARVNQWYIPTDYYNIINYSTYQYPLDAPDCEKFSELEAGAGGTLDTMRHIYAEDAMVVAGQINSWAGTHTDRLGTIDHAANRMRRLVTGLLREEAALAQQSAAHR